MQRSGIMSIQRTRAFGGLASVVVGAGLAIAACGDETESPTQTSSTTTTTSSSGAGGAGSTTTTTATTGPGGGGQGGEGGGGQPAYACGQTAQGATRGSAIAISPDDTLLVSANRDVGTVTVARVDYTDGQPAMTKVAELDLGAGSEPYQVAIDGCGTRAYVVLRKDQRLVAIDDLTTTPVVGPSVQVGSEPTGLALSPNNTAVYVANWVDGTITAVDPARMTVKGTVDLNVTLAATGLLGTVAPRPALAHPRAIAITNDGDTEDSDESVYVTEWFAQRTGPETLETIDTNRKGLLYAFTVGATEATAIDLPPIVDTGFPDHNGAPTGCFPNQIGSVTILNGFAYVTSVCASPKGPLGVFTQAGTCTTDAQCGAVGGSCNLATQACNPNTTDVKTTTHPGLTIVNLTDRTAQTVALDKSFADAGATRVPHLPTDVGFVNNFAYVTAMGTDAVFRLVTGGGQITAVGSQTNRFIDLRRPAGDTLIRNPIGIATAHAGPFAFVANDGSRDITALAFSQQAIAGSAANNDFRILQASELPAPGSQLDKELRGKRFFNTGLGRWSLNGEGWGSCAACHIDGLSDNVTWYFARGPRQSTSLDGSFASNDPTDQRIFNWTAIFDEVADFELNTRNTSGGVGAIVSRATPPISNADRINLAAETPPQQGLQGSTADVASPAGTSPHPHSVLDDWAEIDAWMKIIRSPRRPTTLVQADVDAGRALFSSTGTGNCAGCHSGEKWTISKRFYTPNDIANSAAANAGPTSLAGLSWNVNLNGFPAALFPVNEAAVDLATTARMRFGVGGQEQIQCILRPVGTFNVAPAAVGILEVRQNMTPAPVAQGAENEGRGYNPPSLLGVQVGAPFFHAGMARTLEELFNDTLFSGHHRSAVAQVFSPTETTVRQLVAFMLSVDEDTAPFAIPAKGATGGDICFYLP